MTVTIGRRRFGIDAARLTAVAASAALLGCRSQKTSTDGSLRQSIVRKVQAIRGKQERTLRLLFPKGCLANLQPVVKEFTSLTGVKFELREADLTAVSADVLLENRLARSGARFDVAIPATFALPDLAESGALLPLNDLAEEHEPPGFTTNSIYTLGDRYKGTLYGYQADGDAYVMFYNGDWQREPSLRDTYEQAHSVPLEIPKTWQELDRQMRFFHQPSSARFGGSLFRNLDYMAWEFWVRFHAKGYFPVRDDMSPQLNNPAGVAALEELISASKFLEPASRTNGLFKNFQSFAEGNKYCNLGWGGTQKFLNGPSSKIKNKLAFGVVPGGTIGGQDFSMPYFNWGWNYVVSSRTPLKDTAYLFILFASGALESTLSVGEAEGYFDPHRTEHYADGKIRESYGEDFLSVHQKSLTECIPDFYLRGQGEYFAALRRGVLAADRRYLTPSAALDQISSKWNLITESLGQAEQSRQWRFLQASYPVHLRELLV